MKIALAGNPNSGKTTLFNELTKMNQKIGNWPGVTTEKKEGRYFRDKNIEIIDLPGVYSLNPISGDEKVTCDFLKNTPSDLVINVIDSASLERSLSLTLQLLETGIPVILALNMADELKLNGITLDINKIENELKVPAILISARKNKNITELMDKAVECFKAKDKSVSPLTKVGNIRSDNAGTLLYSLATEEEKAEIRYKYIASKIDLFRIKSESKAKKITGRIDKIVMNKWLAFPVFAFVIWFMYFVSIQTVGSLSINALESLFGFIGESVRKGLENINSPQWVASLAVDGVIAGVGAVLTFIPQILILFLFITFLEGCGYMSRAAVIMDRLFRKIGLSGKSFIPMIVGCGCTVPAIMSAKTVEGDIERKSTIMLTPFMPCSAKLPVFALMAGALFPDNSFVAPSMYFLGILTVILGGLLLKLFRRKKAGSDAFLIELPHYRLPKVKNIFLDLWDKIKGFIIKAGVIIVPAAIILWFLQSFSFSFKMVSTESIEDSMLAVIGKGIAWIFYPLGFGNWQSAIAVISGFFAKETVVATFGVLLGGAGDVNSGLAELFTPQAAYAFMALILLSAPCIAAIGAIKKEIGGTKWMFIAIGFQCAVGYIAALIINQLGNLWAYNSAVCISVLAGVIIALIMSFSAMYIIKSKKKGRGCAAGCCGCSRASACKHEKSGKDDAKTEGGIENN